MEPEGAYGKQPEAMKEMGGSLNRALFQGPPHAVRAYFEQHAARERVMQANEPAKRST